MARYLNLTEEESARADKVFKDVRQHRDAVSGLRDAAALMLEEECDPEQRELLEHLQKQCNEYVGFLNEMAAMHPMMRLITAVTGGDAGEGSDVSLLWKETNELLTGKAGGVSDGSAGKDSATEAEEADV